MICMSIQKNHTIFCLFASLNVQTDVFVHGIAYPVCHRVQKTLFWQGYNLLNHFELNNETIFKGPGEVRWGEAFERIGTPKHVLVRLVKHLEYLQVISMFWYLGVTKSVIYQRPECSLRTSKLHCRLVCYVSGIVCDMPRSNISPHTASYTSPSNNDCYW